jgi:hypothetical protein
MNSRLRAAPLIAVAVLSSCARQPTVRVVATDGGQGKIEGIVMYEDGRPAKGATVSTFPLRQTLAAEIPSADTDEAGHFQINHLWFGELSVSAKKEDEGYPDTSSGFYSDSKIAPKSLSLSHPFFHVNNGMVWHREAFFLSDSLYPPFDRQFVGEPQFARPFSTITAHYFAALRPSIPSFSVNGN